MLQQHLTRQRNKRPAACVPVQVLPYETHNCEGPSDHVTTNKAELMEFFEVMYRMRRMEIANDMLYKTKLIRGFCHLYDGQEAVVTGLTYGSTMQDSIITSYRVHAQHLVRGGTVSEVIGELLGRSNGASRGLGGSMHMYSEKHKNYGGSGIVGAQVRAAPLSQTCARNAIDARNDNSARPSRCSASCGQRFSYLHSPRAAMQEPLRLTWSDASPPMCRCQWGRDWRLRTR
jgi:Dehydrogenase E1 component